MSPGDVPAPSWSTTILGISLAILSVSLLLRFAARDSMRDEAFEQWRTKA